MTVRQRELGMRLRDRSGQGLTVEEVAEKLLAPNHQDQPRRDRARRPSLRDVLRPCALYNVSPEESAD